MYFEHFFLDFSNFGTQICQNSPGKMRKINSTVKIHISVGALLLLIYNIETSFMLMY